MLINIDQGEKNSYSRATNRVESCYEELSPVFLPNPNRPLDSTFSSEIPFLMPHFKTNIKVMITTTLV